jgi:hypothetical protein
MRAVEGHGNGIRNKVPGKKYPGLPVDAEFPKHQGKDHPKKLKVKIRILREQV